MTSRVRTTLDGQQRGHKALWLLLDRLARVQAAESQRLGVSASASRSVGQPASERGAGPFAAVQMSTIIMLVESRASHVVNATVVILGLLSLALVPTCRSLQFVRRPIAAQLWS